MSWHATRTGVVLSLIAAAGCGAERRTGTSSVELVVDRLEAASGTGSTFTTLLRSDVLRAGSPHPDRGRIVLRVRLRDPGPAGAPTVPSAMNVVTVTRYRVAFRRSDGRRVEGRDVPYAVDGAVTVTVGESATPIEFTLVRAQAKLEPPLRTLAGAESSSVLSMSAEVSVHGRDGRGRAVTATGSLTVHFADWDDSGAAPQTARTRASCRGGFAGVPLLTSCTST
ncbi:MAG: hypothetical protein ACRD2X_23230 [Vicinamibacteraceae bacterium]